MQSRSFPDHRRCGISLRGRQPSDAVQEYLRRRLSLLVGLDAHPCQMVDRHGDDGDDLQCVAAQFFKHHLSLSPFFDYLLAAHSLIPARKRGMAAVCGGISGRRRITVFLCVLLRCHHSRLCARHCLKMPPSNCSNSGLFST